MPPVPHPLPPWRRCAPVQVHEVPADCIIPATSRSLDGSRRRIPRESPAFLRFSRVLPTASPAISLTRIMMTKTITTTDDDHNVDGAYDDDSKTEESYSDRLRGEGPVG